MALGARDDHDNLIIDGDTVTEPGDDLAAMRARNAAAREQVDSLLDQFNRQTQQLAEAQQQAAQASATVTSKDGLVRATVDAQGVLASLELAPRSFERSSPGALGQTVTQTVREATLQVKQQVADLMAPLTEGGPDLSELFEGAPSLQGLLPSIPDFSATSGDSGSGDSGSGGSAAEPRQGGRRRRADDPEDEPPETWLMGGR